MSGRASGRPEVPRGDGGRAPMRARLVPCCTWLVATLIGVAGLLVLTAASGEAQPAVRHVLLLQSFPRGNMPDDHLTGNFRVDLDRRAGQAVNVVQIVV